MTRARRVQCRYTSRRPRCLDHGPSLFQIASHPALAENVLPCFQRPDARFAAARRAAWPPRRHRHRRSHKPLPSAAPRGRLGNCCATSWALSGLRDQMSSSETSGSSERAGSCRFVATHPAPMMPTRTFSMLRRSDFDKPYPACSALDGPILADGMLTLPITYEVRPNFEDDYEVLPSPRTRLEGQCMYVRVHG